MVCSSGMSRDCCFREAVGEIADTNTWLNDSALIRLIGFEYSARYEPSAASWESRAPHKDRPAHIEFPDRRVDWHGRVGPEVAVLVVCCGLTGSARTGGWMESAETC